MIGHALHVGNSQLLLVCSEGEGDPMTATLQLREAVRKAIMQVCSAARPSHKHFRCAVQLALQQMWRFVCSHAACMPPRQRCKVHQCLLAHTGQRDKTTNEESCYASCRVQFLTPWSSCSSSVRWCFRGTAAAMRCSFICAVSSTSSSSGTYHQSRVGVAGARWPRHRGSWRVDKSKPPVLQCSSSSICD